jgi:hypothetical protein
MNPHNTPNTHNTPTPKKQQTQPLKPLSTPPAPSKKLKQMFKGEPATSTRKRSIPRKSYAPTVNQNLITLRTTKRKTIHTKDCNKNPFLIQNTEDFKLRINGVCYSFFEKPAIEYLLHNLSANKHVNPKTLITPKQYDSNCWFNVMFVIYFISDKGRLFFHFLRQLMITGTQANGTPIDPELWKTFSLLNYFVDISAKGDPLAKNINTNAIILQLYHIIKNKTNVEIYNRREAGNPIFYYNTLINFLNNQDINILQVFCDPQWKQSVEIQLTKFLDKTKGKMPHIILLDFSISVSKAVDKTRCTELVLNNKRYRLDSACIIDIEREHFSSCLTLERQDYMYDGMSNHRLFKKPWKKLLNSNVEWSFAGSTNSDGSLKKWSFMNGYHVLFYYMV